MTMLYGVNHVAITTPVGVIIAKYGTLAMSTMPRTETGLGVTHVGWMLLLIAKVAVSITTTLAVAWMKRMNDSFMTIHTHPT
jgi:hypothetical protein